MDCPHFDHHAVLADEERYRRYAELRACPVARSDAAGGFWILSRFDDVAAAAEDWRTYSSAEGVLAPAPAGRRARQVALEQDPPEHTVYRKLYAELLGRPACAASRPTSVLPRPAGWPASPGGPRAISSSTWLRRSPSRRSACCSVSMPRSPRSCVS
ncbi:MAG: hypothetical protein R2755_00270 [Acidimicrobiales bacterium]